MEAKRLKSLSTLSRNYLTDPGTLPKSTSTLDCQAQKMEGGQ